MAEFLLENWKLIASFLLAGFNLFVTLFVHSRSKKRIDKVESNNEPLISGLQAILSATSAIMEKLNEKNT